MKWGVEGLVQNPESFLNQWDVQERTESQRLFPHGCCHAAYFSSISHAFIHCLLSGNISFWSRSETQFTESNWSMWLFSFSVLYDQDSNKLTRNNYVTVYFLYQGQPSWHRRTGPSPALPGPSPSPSSPSSQQPVTSVQEHYSITHLNILTTGWFPMIPQIQISVYLCVFVQPSEEELVRRKTQYSSETGRIIPPTSWRTKRREFHTAKTHPGTHRPQTGHLQPGGMSLEGQELRVSHLNTHKHTSTHFNTHLHTLTQLYTL